MSLPRHGLTATQALKLLKANSMSVEMYARALLDRISERDKVVKAWAYMDPELVLKQARALDALPVSERGPLHGLAIGVKDTMNTKDMPTQFGSSLYRGNESHLDSSAVAILRNAGALIFGKTTTPDFAVLNSGPDTTNPHDPNRTPGGSSCGSAAAVADLQVPLSLGSQTGGSVIRPASYTGVFAMKPTFNTISTEGQKASAPSFDTLGFFARSIEDLQLLADVFAIKDDVQSKDVPLEEMSVALIRTPMWASAGPGTASAVGEAAAILRNHGVQVEDVTFPPEVADGSLIKKTQNFITLSEARVSFLNEYRLDRAQLAPELCDIVENKANITHEDYVQASDAYADMRRIVNGLAKKYTVILTPSAVDEAPFGLQDMGSPVFNTMWTGFHMPVINIPAFVGESGMPVGVSLVGPRFFDQQLLTSSRALSEVLMKHGGFKIKSDYSL